MIKQALGHGVLEQAKAHQEESKKGLIDFLETLLTPLLPTKQTIRRKLEKTVGEAVELANSMACEQALYHWRIVPVGSAAEETLMEWSDMDQRGHVVLCTFPMCSESSKGGRRPEAGMFSEGRRGIRTRSPIYKCGVFVNRVIDSQCYVK